jgi:hypothetical protein
MARTRNGIPVNWDQAGRLLAIGDCVCSPSNVPDLIKTIIQQLPDDAKDEVLAVIRKDRGGK